MAVTVAQLLIQIGADVQGAVSGLNQTSQAASGVASAISALSAPFQQVISLLEVVANRTSSMSALLEQSGGSVGKAAAATSSWTQELREQQMALRASAIELQQARVANEAMATSIKARAQTLAEDKQAMAASAQAIRERSQAQNISLQESKLAFAQEAMAVKESAQARSTALAQEKMAYAQSQQPLKERAQSLREEQMQIKAAEAPMRERAQALKAEQLQMQAGQQAFRERAQVQNNALQQEKLALEQSKVALREQARASAEQAKSAKDAASASKDHAAALGGLSSMLQNATKKALELSLAIIGIKSAQQVFNAIKETVIGYNAALEQSTNAMAVMLRGVNATTGALNPFSVGMERARALTLAMQELALKSPFEFKDIQRSAGELLRYGIAVKDVIGLVKDIQNVGAAIAASGGDAAGTMERLAYAIGQVHAAGVVRGQELRQLYNAGVSIGEVYEIIGQKIGKTTGQIAKMQEEGKLSSKIFIEAFQTWSKANFGDMAAIQAHTFNGAMNNIKEGLLMAGSTAFGPLFQRISQLAQQIAEFVTSADFQKWAVRVAAAVDVILDGLGVLMSGFGSAMSGILHVVTSFGQAIYQALQWINPFARHSPSLVESVEDGLARVTAAFEKMGRSVPPSIAAAGDAVTHFKELVGGFKESRDLEEALKALAYVNPAAGGAFTAAQAAIKDMLADAEALNPELAAWKEQVDGLTEAHVGWKRMIKEVDDSIRDLKIGLAPLQAEIRANRIELLQWQADLANVNEKLRQAEQAEKPFKDAVKVATDALKESEIALREVDAQIKINEASLAPYKLQLASLQSDMDGLRLKLSTAKDAWSDLNDQVQRSKNLMKEAANQPLAGERDLAEKILQQEAKVETARAAVLQAKSRGATKEAERLQKDVDKLQGQLDLLQSQKKINFDLPHAQLNHLADAGKPEVGNFDTRKETINNIASGLPDLEKQADAQKAVAEGVEDEVRAKQKEINSVNETIRLQRESWSQLVQELAVRQANKDLAQNQVDIAQVALDRQVLMKSGLESEKLGIEENISRLESVGKVLEANLALASAPLIELQAEKELRENMASDVQTSLDDAKTSYDDIKATQAAIIAEAGNWQQALDKVKQEAIQLQHEMEAEARKNKGDTAPGGSERFLDIDAGLADWKTKVEGLDKDFQKAKDDFREWIDETKKGFEEAILPFTIFWNNWQDFMDNDGMDPISAAFKAMSVVIGATMGTEAQTAFDDFIGKAGIMFSALGTLINGENGAIPTVNAFIARLTPGLINEGLKPVEDHLNNETKDALTKHETDVNNAKAAQEAMANMLKNPVEDALNGLVLLIGGAVLLHLGKFKDGVLALMKPFTDLVAYLGGEYVTLMSAWLVFEGTIIETMGKLKDVLGLIVEIFTGWTKIELAKWFTEQEQPMKDHNMMLDLLIAKPLQDLINLFTGPQGLFTAFEALNRWLANGFTTALASFNKSIQDNVITPLTNIKNAITGAQQEAAKPPPTQGAGPAVGPIPPVEGTPPGQGQISGAGAPGAATGDVVDRPTLRLVGEGGQRELISPEPLMRKIVREETGGGITAEALVQALSGMGVYLDGRKVGNLVAQHLSNEAGHLASAGAA